VLPETGVCSLSTAAAAGACCGGPAPAKADACCAAAGGGQQCALKAACDMAGANGDQYVSICNQFLASAAMSPQAPAACK